MSQRMIHPLVFVIITAVTFGTFTQAASSESAASYYRGKTVQFVVPYAPGGSYDVLARLTAPYLAKHLGATVIVRNEPGAGAKLALNRLTKETNGLSLFTCAIATAAVSQIFGETGVKFDLTKFNWLGTMGKDEYVVVVGRHSGYKSIPDLQQAKEVKFGTDTRTSGTAIRPMVMSYILGVNAKVVAGYKGAADEVLAMLKGEVDGVSLPLLNLLPYIKSQDVIPLIAWSPKRFKLLPTTPTIFEVKKLSAQEQRIAGISVALNAIGRPVATTPDVPRERVSFLESALKKALEEPGLLEKVEKLGETMDYEPGKETAQTVNLMLSIREDEKTILGKLMGVQGYLTGNEIAVTATTISSNVFGTGLIKITLMVGYRVPQSGKPVSP